MGLFDLDNLLTKLTPEEVLKRTTEEALWIRYLGHCKLNKLIKVPPCLREGVPDKDPSGVLFRTSSMEIVLFDHARRKTYGIFLYLRKLYANSNFNDILKMINKDMNLGIGELQKTNNNNMVITRNATPIEEVIKFKTNTRISWEQFALDKFSMDAIRYWNSYGITKETLDFFDVVQVNAFIIGRYNELTSEHTTISVKVPPGELAFVYQFSEYEKYAELSKIPDFSSCKIYMPLSKNKWVTNTTKYCIGGLKQFYLLQSLFNKKVADLSSEIDLKKYMVKDYNEPRYSEYKMLQNISGSTIEELRKHPIFKNIIITKSMKDVMTWYELGIPAICTQAEYNVFPLPKLLTELEEWFDNIYLNYDNDEVGINASISMVKNTLLIQKTLIFIDEYKDISGLVYNKSLTEAKNAISFLNEK